MIEKQKVYLKDILVSGHLPLRTVKAYFGLGLNELNELKAKVSATTVDDVENLEWVQQSSCLETVPSPQVPVAPCYPSRGCTKKKVVELSCGKPCCRKQVWG